MDRDAKLAAARKKLKQFKRKKAPKAENQPTEHSEITSIVKDVSNTPQGHEKDISEIKKSEEFIDEKFELLNCTEDESLSESTAATTESILQVSAKLNGIVAEADMFVDDASVQSSEEKFQMIEHPKMQDREAQNDLITTLELRNRELAAKLSSSSQEREELNGRCEQLSDQLDILQKQFEEKEKWRSKAGEENALHEQLQVQMQTIGVLVSEKQDLQQELLTTRSELHTSNLQQKKTREDIQLAKEKVVSYERGLQSKNDMISVLENDNALLQSECRSRKNELDNIKEALEKEQIQSSELGTKLQTREIEYRELYTSHVDAHEKLEMADVLLQQMSANNDSDSASRLVQLQQENQALTSRLNEYQQAFEQLTAEREQLSQQYNDTQKKWEDHLQNMQLEVQTSEAEKQILLQQYNQLQTTLEIKNTDIEAEKPDASEVDMEDPAVRKELELALKTQSVLRVEISAQQNNNQHLSHLVQEKESRIYELENELDQVKASISEHEQLLDGARSDKVTISRALLQNKQLKEQLEEIQEGFIRMSNDKMDLATQVSALEHANKDLQLRLTQCAALYQETKQNLDMNKTDALHSHQHITQLQTEITNLRSSLPLNEDDSEIIDILKLKIQSAEESARELAKENKALKTELETFTNFSSISPRSENPILQPSQQSGNLPFSNTVENGAKSHPNDVAEDDTLIRPDAAAMLQEKFTTVMKEKAELLNRLELLEHTNTQLQNECDTIGEYIALYHNQRLILKQRHREKDEYISTIIHEREAMQGKVEQLQTLIVAMFNNRRNISGDDMSPTPHVHFSPNLNMDSSQSDGCNETPLRPGLQQAQPDLVPKSDISITEEDSGTSPHNALPGRSKKIHTSSESSSPERDDATTTQILTLLEQMQKPIDPGASLSNSMPSGFCMRYIGPYTAI